MFLRLRSETQDIQLVDDVPEIVTALELVLDLAEHLTDLVLDSVGAGSADFEAVQVRKKLRAYKLAQVVACHRPIVVNRPACTLWRGPRLPAILLVEDELVLFAFQFSLGRTILFKRVEVLQEEQPRGLLGVV